MKKNVNILDGTSKIKVMNAISKFQKTFNCTVLTCFVSSVHQFILVEYDGISVCEWSGKIDDLLSCDITKMELRSVL